MILRIPRKRRIDSMLSLYRRLTFACPHRRKGVRWLKCNCPVWTWGELPNRQWVCKSVGTRSMSQARRTVEQWEREQKTDVPPSVEFATEAFLQQHKDDAAATLVKYGKIMRLFLVFCEHQSYERVDQLRVETFDVYRQTRDVAPATWANELQVLRGLCEYAYRRDWIARNFAREVETPKNIKPANVEPYTEFEMVAILQACDRIGQEPYERLRARAMVLAMRYTALAITDVYLLRRDQVRDGMVETRRTKTGKPVLLPVPADLQAALDLTPLPVGAAPDCAWYFHNGYRHIGNAVRRCSRAMKSVFRVSGVAGGKTHRFRHTLATRMLEQGASYEDVAAVLGNSARIVEKHYAKWSKGRQERITRLFKAAHGMSDGAEMVQ